MTETVKKTTTRKPKAETTAKAAKATTNGKAPAIAKAPVIAKAPAIAKVTKNNLTVMHPSKEQIAALAHKYWAERGYQHGRDADDWFRAEQELTSKAS